MAVGISTTVRVIVELDEYNRMRVSHKEHKAMWENRLEEIDLSAGITKRL